MRRVEVVARMTRELVRRAIEGDHDAFSSLVDASVDRLYSVAPLILRDSDRAQDAVQEALMSAWKDVRALRDPDAWDAWLHRITVWACYRAAKKERRRNRVELKIVDCPYRGPCETLLESGFTIRDLTCARIGCFRASAEILSGSHCKYEVTGFRPDGICEGYVEHR